MFQNTRTQWMAAAALVLLCSPATADTEANKTVVREMTEAINRRDLDALDALVAADIKRHSDATPGVTVENLEQFKAFLETDFATVPNSVQEIHQILAEGDLVALRASYSGNQHGAFGPFPPSGKPLKLTFMGILRIEDGKVAEIWVEWDNLGVLAQLGHFPPPQEGASTP